MFIKRRLKGVVVDYNQCIEICLPRSYSNGDFYRHLELYDVGTDYMEHYENCRYNDIFFKYIDLVIEYNLKKKTKQILFSTEYCSK